MEFMTNFPAIFKGPEQNTGDCLPGGQKVVCTPEVSLYQYSGTDVAGGPPRLEEKGAGIQPVTPNGSATSTGGFQCGFCGKTFQQKNTFQNHLRSHREGEDPYQCDICGKTFAVPARLTRHYRTHTGEKPYQCEYCNKSFSVKENLSVHRRIHTKERPYKCEVCERAFEHSGKLHRHMRIHTGERPHRCQICQKTFIQSGQLVIHMRTHTGEKPYVCKVCNKGFTCSKQLKVHTRTHTGEKPYTCDICGKSFGYNHVLKLHQVAHYGEKVYKCTLCNGTFNSKKALETHIKTHSSDQTVMNSLHSPIHVAEPALSPSSNLQTPQNSDKENRESSDSEISSQSSPTIEAPKTPPSPMMVYSNSSPSHHHHQNHFKPNVHNGSSNYGVGPVNGNNISGHANNTSINGHGSHPNGNSSSGNPLPNVPYPMLPPGIQVHQAPQSRTTFLYVTSKLPSLGSNNNNGLSGSNANSTSSGVPQNEQQLSPRHHHNVNVPPGVNFKTFGSGLANHGKSMQANDKLFQRSASLTDTVLAFTEKFGYGIPSTPVAGVQLNGQSSLSGGNLAHHSSSSNSSNSCSPPINDHKQRSDHNQGLYNGFSRSRCDMSRSNHNSSNRHRMENSDNGGIAPENLSVSYAMNKNSPFTVAAAKNYDNDEYYCRSFSRSRSRERDGSISPESNGSYNGISSYTPGGVLALALTRGSKAVANQIAMNSMSNSNFNPNFPNHNLPLSNPASPELCIDFSRRSVSPRNSVNSPSPTSTPRSTPGLSESAEDLSDEYVNQPGSRSSSSSQGSSSSGKRTRSSSSSYGPRKRSSLILEKYAQENPATPGPSNASSTSTESILSQRLRLSSVIQYAEKCT